MNKKEFKTLDEQLGIFKSKGLTINDEEEARNILLKENYFFINGYRRVLMVSSKEKKFVKGATFDELYAIFMFDREFRNILFKNLFHSFDIASFENFNAVFLEFFEKYCILEESFSNSEIKVNSEFSGRTSDKFFTCSALFAANIQFFSGLTAFSIE